LRLKNVILDEKRRITAIIDWEECMSQIAPYWELSIALHDLTMDEKQSFLDGYGLDLKEFIRIDPGDQGLESVELRPHCAACARPQGPCQPAADACEVDWGF